jgi:hypothetical protein
MEGYYDRKTQAGIDLDLNRRWSRNEIKCIR